MFLIFLYFITAMEVYYKMSSLLYSWEDIDPRYFQDNITDYDIEKHQEEQLEIWKQKLEDEVIF